MKNRSDLSSNQEKILERFMHISFGTRSLFAENKYMRNGQQKEAVDLAWVNGGFVVLFNMTSGKKSLAKQTYHNVKQLANYLRIWKSGKESFDLRGVNRFKEQCLVRYADVEQLVLISIVSHECAISIVGPNSADPSELWLNIPEHLISWLSDFGGSIVDLLRISFSSLKNTPLQSFPETQLLVQLYVSRALYGANALPPIPARSVSEDFQLIFRLLRGKKLLGPNASTSIENTDSIIYLSGFFSDMGLLEYATITAGAMHAISTCEPPSFRNWCIAETSNLYYRFVIAVVNMTSANTPEVIEDALNLSKATVDKPEATTFVFANIEDANDYRHPHMIIPQAVRQPLQAITITREFLARHGNSSAS